MASFTRRSTTGRGYKPLAAEEEAPKRQDAKCNTLGATPQEEDAGFNSISAEGAAYERLRGPVLSVEGSLENQFISRLQRFQIVIAAPARWAGLLHVAPLALQNSRSG